VFLGWEAPPLESAARWLADAYGRDLADVVVALPGRRAGRRLEDLLVARMPADCALPRVVTAGRLTDLLLDVEGVPAGRLVRTTLWSLALAERKAAALRPLVAEPPPSRDRAAWAALAETVRSLHGALAAEDVGFEDVLEHLERERSAPRSEVDRWRLLVELAEDYRRRLADLDLVDPHDARRSALAAGRLSSAGDVVLVGVTEASALLRRTLAARPSGTTALVVGSEDEADAFDELGCVRPEAWAERELPLDTDRWSVADRPADQPEAAAGVLARWGDRFAADEITVGLPDEQVAPYVERRLASGGVAARHAAGTSCARSAPARLLAAVATCLRSRRFDALAALVRHPAVDAALRTTAGLDGVEPAELLDDYHRRHLPSRTDAGWPGKRTPEGLVSAVHGLLGELTSRDTRPLAEWADVVAACLARIHPGELDAEGDHDLVGALELLGAGLSELAAVPPPVSRAAEASAAEAIECLLRSVGGERVPPPPRAGAVELLGWLDLPLDHARAVVVTGFNDGRIPAPDRALRAHLSEATAEALGLPGRRRRTARDAHALAVLLRTHEEVHLVTGRRSAENDPLLPSRLLFHAPEDEMLARVRKLVDEASREDAATTTAAAPEPARPRPVPRHPHPPALERVSVTAFRDYLASPYHFYLRHVLRTETVDDGARELDGRSFGSLAHDVLEAFGEDEELRVTTDAGRLADGLVHLLRERVRRRHGRRPPPAVAVQVERLALRLRAFAEWQVRRVGEGWRIAHVEWSPEGGGLPFDVDGETIELRGKIDRIDVHEAAGRWAILDYKTGEAGDDPKRTHGPVGGSRWKDLQLPLYRELVGPLGLEGEVELGYVNLPKTLSETGLRRAEWSEEQLAQAVELARDVVRRVRRGELFEVGRFPVFDPIPAAVAGVGLLSQVEADVDEGVTP